MPAVLALDMLLLQLEAFVIDVIVIVVVPEFVNAGVLNVPLPPPFRFTDAVFPVELLGADRL